LVSPRAHEGLYLDHYVTQIGPQISAYQHRAGEWCSLARDGQDVDRGQVAGPGVQHAGAELGRRAGGDQVEEPALLKPGHLTRAGVSAPPQHSGRWRWYSPDQRRR
jgi:hypothetical protein